MMMAVQPQIAMIQPDKADVKSKRFWTWVDEDESRRALTLEGSFYFYFIFFELLTFVLLANTTHSLEGLALFLGAGMLSYLSPSTGRAGEQANNPPLEHQGASVFFSFTILLVGFFHERKNDTIHEKAKHKKTKFLMRIIFD
ncbi:unnamed protein product [Amoebophrya sp. A25]|nr:unnamed protein product [Amoebophrya sp. A25]|eukprot:GSA25T00001587001.1